MPEDNALLQDRHDKLTSDLQNKCPMFNYHKFGFLNNIDLTDVFLYMLYNTLLILAIIL